MLPDPQQIKSALAGRWPEFYGYWVSLTPVGREWRGPCPLHQGRHANFAVDPDTGLWFCHSRCRAGGDALDFLQRREHLTFPEALTALARASEGGRWR